MWLVGFKCICCFRVMAKNSSHIKGRGNGQTASVHPFTRALPRDLQRHAPYERRNFSNSTENSPKVRISSASSFEQATSRRNKALCRSRICFALATSYIPNQSMPFDNIVQLLSD
ncbi:hypothetical protein AVEN_194794-1 [Araneus ventricosus]|uniref:Uncharacterized protein n=1 Tax=Araneus ventricosus TaxID=182803 RepID=A0A4Y2B647_ARAVE|nr:hypothetical protein AVEN_194794-1 [Araneus ventricosus]